jgi:TetR/AcrR family transcriptional regulator, tetracycline repressor protein
MGKPPLSRERILSAALAVIDREGLAAFSMRRLAQELDVWPMSVYRYFRDKEELLDAIAAQSAAAVDVEVAGDSWRDRLRALLKGAHEAMAHEPGGIGGSLARAFLTPEALRLTESALTILLDAGLSRREAASAWRSLWSYTYGSATFQLAPTPDEAHRRARAAIAALPDDDFPTLLASAAEAAAAMTDEAEFDRGLDRLFDAIESRAPAASEP